ncbi:hypothetical protein GXW83_24500 [Streptacidiphilus sp. PB12-B1b]|uniref:hypothetical protein n=1 Tax=Streptacidiphilus sp. PB12-B1b TaxID=2705012 RepID=UPI0015FAA1F9|nr:hypothetical protein [Streptacidiphilus sp. PB12-B1b]QMU78398.1 hypothetical protein GXW83_24500 [Streptacidiphilus sp. PB12-B1b]
MKPTTRHRLDLIAFLAVLATGVLLTAMGISAGTLATIAVALSSLYGVWKGTGPAAPPTPHDSQPPGRTAPPDPPTGS